MRVKEVSYRQVRQVRQYEPIELSIVVEVNEGENSDVAIEWAKGIVLRHLFPENYSGTIDKTKAVSEVKNSGELGKNMKDNIIVGSVSGDDKMRQEAIRMKGEIDKKLDEIRKSDTKYHPYSPDGVKDEDDIDLPF